MVRAASAILLFAMVLNWAPVAVAVPGDEKLLDEKGFVPVDPPQPLPNFLFEDEKGRTLDMRIFQGRYVLLNLWATFCVPCREEMPKFDALSKRLDAHRWAFIAIAEDHDGAAVVRPFFNRHRISHLAVYSDHSGRAPFVLQARGLPTTLLINPKGEEVARLEGAADWGRESMATFLMARAAR